MTRLKELPFGEVLVGLGIIAADRLSVLKIETKLQYVPGHSSILGNTYAHRAARKGAKFIIEKRRAGKLMIVVAAEAARN